VKRLLFTTIMLAAVCGGRLQASGVIDCSGDPSAINTCLASKLPNFQTQLDWAILGQPFDGSVNNSIFSGTQGGINIQVTPVNLSGVGAVEGLRLAYNLGSVFYGGEWTDPGLPAFSAYIHPGHFNQTATPAGTAAQLLADPTIRLLGVALNGTSATGGMLVDFNDPFVNLGFYGAAKHDGNFSLTVKIYDGVGGTGNQLANQTFSYNSLAYQPGGICASLLTTNTAPTGCNNAPFFYASGFNTGRSALITTTDSSGFYLSNLYVGQANLEGAPEPGPMVLCGCGLALLALGSRRLRRRAE
jgi:hypothetical protein